MKTLRKIFKYIILILVFFLIITLVPPLFYSKAINTTPLPLDYKKGVYHMHSTFSDGKGTVNEITRAAAELGLDFVILTDHGRPNIPCAKSTTWHNGVLLIGGSEFSLNCGHLAALGLQVPGYIFPPEPQEAINEVIGEGGVCFISHPFDNRIDWTDWDIHNFTGLEVLNSASAAGKLNLFQFLSFHWQYLFNSNYALLKTIKYPIQNLEKWSSLNANNSGQYYGIYALDTHGKLPVTKRIQLNYPSYKAMFQILTVYVKIEKELVKDPHEAAAVIIDSIKKGKFFNVIEAVAPANGFDARFVQPGGKSIDMGGRALSPQGTLRIRTPFAFETDIIIKKHRSTYRKITNNVKRIVEINVYEPGVYYLELFVSRSRFNKIPWIMTNPLFIGSRHPAVNLKKSKNEQGENLKKLLVARKDFFVIETNPDSLGTLSHAVSKEKELITRFDFRVQKEPAGTDFWSCLARREAFDFSGFTGVVFDARSSKKLRFWVELRTKKQDKETWYSHSFLAEPAWKRILLPFDRFHLAYGKRKMPELSQINSIFFSINNGLAYSGTEGFLELKNIGLY